MKAYSHILVPTDGSPLSLKAANEAAILAKDLAAKITTLYVIPTWRPPIPEESSVMVNFDYTEQTYRETNEARAKEALDQVAAAVEGSNVECEKVIATGAQPWQAILDTASVRDCDLIIMGSHGRGALASLVVGSETVKVLSHSTKPVLVCR